VGGGEQGQRNWGSGNSNIVERALLIAYPVPDSRERGGRGEGGRDDYSLGP